MKTVETYLNAQRRGLLVRGAGLTLSAAAVAMLAGCSPSRARAGTGDYSDDSRTQDLNILNTALRAEFEAVAAYQLGADSGLLTRAMLPVAVQFQGHHREHADLLSQTIRTLGGKPAEPQAQYRFPVDTLASEQDVLTFAAGLERGAVSAYAGAIPLFANSDLAGAAASILADEAMHWAVLRHSLGLDPVPGAFFS